MARGGKREGEGFGRAEIPKRHKAAAAAAASMDRGKACSPEEFSLLDSVIDARDFDAVLQRVAEADQLAEAASDSDLVMDLRRLRKEQEALHASSLRVPRRPRDAQMNREEHIENERWAFLLWLKNLARLEENDKLVLTPFEKNIDIWRQLWRVLERSDLLVMVVDARDPLFYRCPDLEAYAKEIDEHKRTMLLVNKADLLPLDIRKMWADYFKAHDILYVFWSAKAATATLEGKKLSGNSEEESASLDLDTKIYGRDELLMKLQAEAESIVAQRRTSTSVDDQEASSSDSVSSVAKHVVVGFVGYPNVGKSSTINSLVGEKQTGVTHTPGKTKHFQTLIISEELTLCDCPGLVFPSFLSSRHEMVACGVLPIDRMTKHREAIQVVADRVPRDILEQIYKITLPKPKPYEPQSRPPTAAELLRAYCASRGRRHAGLPDETRAARQILKDYIDSKIPHFELPPVVTDSHHHEFNLPSETWKNNTGFDTWKELWKVLRSCDFAYAKEIDEHKRTMLLVNKADLLPLNIRKRWADYFKANDIPYVFWSAQAATATLEGKKLSGNSEEESASLDLDTKIYGRDELLMKLQAEAESIVAQRRTSTSVDDQEASSSVAKHVVVGFVGYPNVGKTSTINVLRRGEERTGVTHTPGMIKLVIYDSPGQFLPTFSVPCYGLLPQEGISFEELATHKLCCKAYSVLHTVEVSRAKMSRSLVELTRMLRFVAENIRVWLQSMNEVKILIKLYLMVAKEIACLNDENVRTISEAATLLKDMVCDVESITSKLMSKKKQTRAVNGQQVKLFEDHHMDNFIKVNLWLVKKLESLLAKLPLWKADSSSSLLDNVKKLRAEIQSYKDKLNSRVQYLKGPREIKWFMDALPPQTREITRCLDVIDKHFFTERTPTDLNVPIFTPAEKKFHKTVMEARRHGPRNTFVLELNPLFKHKEHIVSVEVYPKCMRCFESTGPYFNTCCGLILCGLCALKSCLFCKNPHLPGKNLLFPIIERKRPVLPPNQLQGGS